MRCTVIKPPPGGGGQPGATIIPLPSGGVGGSAGGCRWIRPTSGCLSRRSMIRRSMSSSSTRMACRSRTSTAPAACRSGKHSSPNGQRSMRVVPWCTLRPPARVCACCVGARASCERLRVPLHPGSDTGGGLFRQGVTVPNPTNRRAGPDPDPHALPRAGARLGQPRSAYISPEKRKETSAFVIASPWLHRGPNFRATPALTMAPASSLHVHVLHEPSPHLSSSISNLRTLPT